MKKNICPNPIGVPTYDEPSKEIRAGHREWKAIRLENKEQIQSDMSYWETRCVCSDL